jgi:hypothetical protein
MSEVVAWCGVLLLALLVVVSAGSAGLGWLMLLGGSGALYATVELFRLFG